MTSRNKGFSKSKKRQRAKRRTANTSAAKPGAWFEKLVALQKRLRAPNGCPWDREQTHSTLRTYLIEEAYEVLDALETGDDAKFAEEMGDLLLQIVFHSQIAAEERRFTISDVIREIHEKMVRRHPHVFGKKRAKDAAEVLKNWELIKARERREKDAETGGHGKSREQTSLLDGVPRGLPATLEGLQLTKKAARIGFDWADAQGIFEKLREEFAEVQHAVETGEAPRTEEELGDLFFAAVNLARFLRVDPEIALKKANAKFARRFRAMERLASNSGYPLDKVSRPEMEALWEAAKRGEHKIAALAVEAKR